MAKSPESVIMYYVQDENKKIQLEVLCISLSVTTRQLKPSDLNEQIGRLAGINSNAPIRQAQKAPVVFRMPEVIIFSGIPDNKLDEFLLSYKTLGLTPTELKAVITPHNVNWTLYQLLTELANEHKKLRTVNAV